MDGKKFLQDACSKYNLDFDSLFYVGRGTKFLSEYKSPSGYKKATIVQHIPVDCKTGWKYVVKFMEKDQIYIAWRWKGRMNYNISVKDVQAREGIINEVPHYISIIGGEQESILIFKPDTIEKFIGNYDLGVKTPRARKCAIIAVIRPPR